MPSQNSESSDTTTGEEKKKARFYVRFVRQELEAGWQPVPTARSSILFFGVLALSMLPLGIVFLFQTLQVDEERVRYDDKGPFEGLTSDERVAILSDGVGRTVQFEHTVREDLDAPVYLYYELPDFFQNHKRYVRSRDDNQLGGETEGKGESKCDPERFLPGREKTDNNAINPCGLLPWSYFNDTFEATLLSPNGNVPLEIVADDISWKWDRKYLYDDFNTTNFNTVPDVRGGSVIIGPVNEDFRFHVWMRVAARPTVRKLYGEINRDLKEGDALLFTVVNRYNTYGFDGQKFLILSNMNWTGGRNMLLGVVYIIVGSAAGLLSVVMLITEMKYKRSFGDLNRVSWAKS